MLKQSLRIMIGGGVVLTLTAAAAMAQNSQSADQIINALKPGASLSTTTRGIEPLSDSSASASPGAATPSAPTAMAGPVTARSTGVPSTSLAIAFATGSANLTPRATAQLDQLGKALTSAQLAAYTFKIVGHTDTVGDPATNQTLSDQRAQAVKSYLESKFGVPDTRLQATGVGENELLVQTPPQTPESRNREVQIVNLGH